MDCTRPLIEENWMAEEWEKRRPALEMAQYLGEERLTLLYWEHLHSLMPAGKHREFIAELGVGKPARREPQR